MEISMSGKRLHSYRQGDIAEGIGLEVLRTFSLIAPIPRADDVGIDALATLLRREGQYLFPEESFFVQVKSVPTPSTWKHQLVSDEIHWLRQLELPMFLAAVSLPESLIRIYSYNAVNVLLARNSLSPELNIKLGRIQDEVVTRDAKNAVYLGDPISILNVSDAVSNEASRLQAYGLLKAHVQREKLNLLIRDAGLCYWWAAGIMSERWPWNRDKKGDFRLEQFGQRRLSQSVLNQLGHLIPALESVLSHREVENLLAGFGRPATGDESERLPQRDQRAIEDFAAFLERRRVHPLPSGRE